MASSSCRVGSTCNKKIAHIARHHSPRLAPAYLHEVQAAVELESGLPALDILHLQGQDQGSGRYLGLAHLGVTVVTVVVTVTRTVTVTVTVTVVAVTRTVRRWFHIEKVSIPHLDIQRVLHQAELEDVPSQGE